MSPSRNRNGPVDEGSKGPRLLAVRILSRWEKTGQRLDLITGRVEESEWLTDLDRALLHEIVLGTVRHRRRLDYLLDSFCSKGLESLPGPILNVLRVGAYQIVFCDRIPLYAAINESVNITKQLNFPGLAGVVNATLRRFSESHHSVPLPDPDTEPIRCLGISHSFPDWLVERFCSWWGKEAAIRFMERANRPSPVCLRINRLRGTETEVLDRLRNEGIQAELDSIVPYCVCLSGNLPPRRISALGKGLVQVQDRSAQLAAFLLDPRPSETILDACSAPGGKATQIAELMGDKGTVIALDRDPDRLDLVGQNARRLGLSSIIPRLGDATGEMGFLPRPPDRALVDAPCSNLGVISRRPDLPWRLEPSEFARLADLQGGILDNVGRHLRPGGVLVYSTCTVAPEENREVVTAFLERNPHFTVAKSLEFLPDETKSLFDNQGFLETLPERNSLDGGFAVRLVKR